MTAATTDAPAGQVGTRLDALAPRWDARRVEALSIAAEPHAVYAALVDADFMDAFRRSRLARTAGAVRTAAERVVARLRHGPPPAPAPVEPLRLADLPVEGEWIALGADPPHEFVFGCAGRFWSGVTSWRRVTPATWLVDEPGTARIACAFRILPDGPGRSRVEYEARTVAAGPTARRRFLRYWRVVSPFVGVIMRSMLRVIERGATR